MVLVFILKQVLIGMADYFYNLLENRTSPLLPLRRVCNSAGANVTFVRGEESFQLKYIYDSCLRNTSLLQIKNYYDIQNKIIPFFNKYPILGIKSLDFNDFKLVANVIQSKEHFTAKGLNQKIGIVNIINLDRKLDTSIENNITNK